MLLELIILLPWLLVPLIWFSGGYQLFGHDIGYHVNTINYAKTLLYSWNPLINLGVDWGIQAPKSLLITTLPEILLALIIPNQRTIQIIVSCFWFVLPSLTMWIFVRSIFPENRHRFLRIYVSIFSMFNFFLLQGWSIFEKTKFSLFSAFPIMVLLLYRIFILKKNIARNAVLTGILFFLLNGGGLIPLYGGIFVTFGMFVLYSIVVTIRNKESIKKLLLSLLLVLVVILGLNAYSIIPTIAESLKSFAGTVSWIGGKQSFVAWEHEISKNASIVNLFRLEGIPDWYDNPAHPYANQFIVKRTLIAASFIPILSIVLGMVIFGLRKESQKNRRLLLLFIWMLLIVGILFAGGSHPPFGAFYEYAMVHVPGFVIFRSSFYKFAQLVWFPVIFLSGYYISLFISEYGKNRSLKTFLSVIFIAGIIFYHYPFFSKIAFDFRTGFSTRLQIPSYTFQMAKKIDTLVPSDGRILLYPPLDAGYFGTPLDTYEWGYYSLDPMVRMISDRTIVVNDLYDPMIIIENMQRALHDADSRSLRAYASVIGITHVLWRGDVIRSEGADRDIPLTQMEKRLSEMTALSQQVSVGPWTLYRVDAQVRPMIYPANHPVFTDKAPSETASLITTLPDNSVLLKGKGVDIFSDTIGGPKLPEVSFKEVNPAKYTADIKGNTDKPFVLVFNQKFDAGWEASAYKTNGQSTVLNSHLEANNFANAWIVDQAGIQRVELTYVPQWYFYYGLAVSGLTLIGIGIYMIRIRKRSIIQKRKIQ